MRLELDHFHSELAVMMKVSTGAHPNVIRMVGCIPEVPYPAVVMEYAPLGNLHNFLLRYKNQVSTYYDRTMRVCCAVNKLIIKHIHICHNIKLFTSSVMQRLPTMLPDTVAVSSVSHVEKEFQDDYNKLALEPQDVLTFAQQIASGMVSTKHFRCMLDTASKVSSASSGVLGQHEHPTPRPCLQEHLAVL